MKTSNDESDEGLSEPLHREDRREVSIVYEVRIRKSAHKSRIVVSLHREDYCKDIAHHREEDLFFHSKKPRHFFDEDDELKVCESCEKLVDQEKRVGSIELYLFLHEGPRVEVRFVGGALLGQWTPGDGLKFEKDAHPVFKKDKAAIALQCWQVPQGVGGIFNQQELDNVLEPRR